MEMILVTFVVAIVLGALFLLPRLSSKDKPKSINQIDNTKTVRAYTKEEVSQHNGKDDCWIIVKDKETPCMSTSTLSLHVPKISCETTFGNGFPLKQIYDVTPYVEEHPGGDSILNNAGSDSTEGFFGPQHATRVFDMVDEFYIGDLKS